MDPLEPLAPIEHVTITQVVAQRLIGLITSGSLGRGDKLPTERELADRLGIGRTTVREALKFLTLYGLLDAKRGSGTYVATDFSSSLLNHVNLPVLLSAQEIEEVFEVREALELHAVKLAVERATDEEVHDIAVYRRLADLQERDVAQETEIDLAFHQSIARASHNTLLMGMMTSFRDILARYMEQSIRMTADITTTTAEHAAVYEAFVARASDAAVLAMKAHLTIGRNLALNVLLSQR